MLRLTFVGPEGQVVSYSGRAVPTGGGVARLLGARVAVEGPGPGQFGRVRARSDPAAVAVELVPSVERGLDLRFELVVELPDVEARLALQES